ncbi:MAG: hypothetical protein GY930_00885 [bacterium]|nr:hypothetical protein [bacterium]
MLGFALALAAIFLPPAGEITRKGNHFELVCHFSNEAAADQALVAVEAIWPQAQKLYDLQEPAEGKLLTVHLYRDAAGYEKAEMGLTKGAFKRNLAFAHHDSMTAHVALQPPLSDDALKVFGLPTQTLRLLAHEGAHLVRYSHMPNYRSHPGWLYDGAANWIDEQVCLELGLFARAEKDPKYSTNIVSVQALVEEGKLPTVAEILQDQTDKLTWGAKYDVRWMLFRYLQAKNGKSLNKVLVKARQLGGGDGYTKNLYDEFVDIFGTKKVAKMDKGFHKYVRSLKPEWNEIFRSLQYSNGTWKQAAFGSNAIAWRTQPVGKEKYSISGSLTILPAPRNQMNLFLGNSELGFFSVAFGAGSGVTLFEYLSEGSRWERRGYADCDALKLGEAFDFKVSVNKKTVIVSVGGEEVIEGQAKYLNLSGPWGLSAQAQAAGIWKLTKAPKM